jgi:Tfp pilus assembly protein FimV
VVSAPASASSVPEPLPQRVGAGFGAAAGADISDGAQTYLVRPGDSLWSIAKALLGPEASPAQVAHAVHRLWALNAERIGTGNPNLIIAGERLRMP